MKNRSGFVSNSSSSSFIVGGISNKTLEKAFPKGNPYQAWQWLQALSELPKSLGVTLFRNGEKVDFRFESDEDCYKNDKVVEYMGCCDQCYGPVRDWTEGEFIQEFAHDNFVLKNGE